MVNQSASKESRPLTISEVAELADVSIATVSRVINKNPHVKKENIEKVEQVLAYYNGPIPRERQKIDETTTIGLIVPDIANPWFPTLIKGIESVSRLRGFKLFLSDSDNDSNIESSNIQAMVDGKVSGLIVVPTDRHSQASIGLVDQGFPVVFLDRQIEREDIYFVTSKNTDGAFQATKYLLSLGHRRIVYIAGTETIDTEWKRREGFLQAIREADIVQDESLIISGDYDTETARKNLAALLQNRADFTAVFASDDVMAYGAKVALNDAGLQIPTDISLIGFDDIAFSSLMGLTTITQSPFELGKNAVILLDDILANRVTTPKRIELPTGIVIRESCAPPRR